MTSGKRLLILFGSALAIGVIAMRITSRPVPVVSRIDTQINTPQSAIPENIVQLAQVGDATILKEDIDWEVALHISTPKISDGEPLGEKSEVKKVEDKPIANPPKPTDKSEDLTPQTSDQLRQRLLVTLIERKILYQWIKEYSEGFDHDNPSRYVSCLSEMKELVQSVPHFFETAKSKEHLKEKLCEQSLIDQYFHEKVLPSTKISDADIEHFYKSHLKDFKEPQRVVFRQILLPTEKSALDLRPKVNKNNFSELARSHSIAPEAANGGKVGPFRKEQLPTFFDIVFNMQLGEISGIVRSDYGYHIIMLLDRIAPSTRSLAEARSSIRARLEEQRKQELFQSWLTTAMNTIPVHSNIGEENP